jgi:hypothetical protein
MREYIIKVGVKKMVCVCVCVWGGIYLVSVGIE